MARYFYALLVFAALFIPAIDSTAHAASPEATRVVALVNARRAAAGLQPVTINATLMAESQRFSGVQASLGRLSHRGVDNTTGGQRLTRAGYRWSFWGENLAAGQQTPEQVVTAWMNSPAHRAVMLNRNAREIGIGHTVRQGDPARFVDYWVMEVGRPR